MIYCDNFFQHNPKICANVQSIVLNDEEVVKTIGVIRSPFETKMTVFFMYVLNSPSDLSAWYFKIPCS